MSVCPMTGNVNLNHCKFNIFFYFIIVAYLGEYFETVKMSYSQTNFYLLVQHSFLLSE